MSRVDPIADIIQQQWFQYTMNILCRSVVLWPDTDYISQISTYNTA